MAAYRQVYDSHHLQADCQEPGSAPEPCATFFYFATCSNLRQVFTRKEEMGDLVSLTDLHLSVNLL